MRLTALFLVLASASLARATNWDVIDPVGNELLGNIVVTSPSTATIPAKQIMPYQLTTGGPSAKTVTPDQPLRVLFGDYCVVAASTNATSRRCGVHVDKKKTTTIALSAFRFDWDPSIFGVSVGPRPEIQISGDSGHSSRTQATSSWMSRPKSEFLPAFDTRFGVSIPALPVFKSQSVSITMGESQAVPLAFPDLRSSFTVKFPNRVFPSPTTCGEFPPMFIHRSAPIPNARFHFPGDVGVGGRYDSSGKTNLVNFVNFDVGSPTARFFTSSNGVDSLVYEIVVNNTFANVLNAQPYRQEIEIKRIDVNDVKLTREDGSTYYVNGTYQIMTKNATGQWSLLEVPLKRQGSCTTADSKTDFATKTGLDVLPGEYKVVVTYTSEEGTETKEYYVDLR